MLRLFFAALLCLYAAPSIAGQTDNAASLLALPAGHTLIDLSVQERTTTTQDLLSARLSVQSTGTDASTLQNQINGDMEKALKIAKGFDSVKASTQSYSVHEFYPTPSQRTIKQWQASQSLQLRSKDKDALLKLAGKLQEHGFILQGLTYNVSDELANDIKNAMLETALAKLQHKAARAAKALGKNSADLLHVNVIDGGSAGHSARAYEAASLSSASYAAPVAQAGESDITITVQTKALLKP